MAAYPSSCYASWFVRVGLAVGLAVSAPLAALAQDAAPQASGGSAPATEAPKPKPKHQKPDPYGTPLDTIMSTRLWADVPPAQDFVKESRPDPRTLEYAPLVGTDPERPKPRDPAALAKLQAELEGDIAKNEAKAKGLRKATATMGAPSPAPKPKKHDTKRKAASETARD